MNQAPKVKSNLEYLRKLFIMPDSPDKFIEFGNELLEMIHDFFQDKGGIHSSITLPELSHIFDKTAIPNEPHLIKDVLSEIKTKIISHSVKVGNPYYIGHMISAIPYFMILLEMITAALNQNQVKIETAKASSFVERELVAWLHRLIYEKPESYYQKHIQNPKVAIGNVTADGTLANLTALLVAREKAFPADKNFPGIRVAGIARALTHYGYDRGVIIVSSRGHYSIKKACHLLGIGEENVVTVPVDENYHMDLKRLNRKLKSLENAAAGKRTKVIALIGIAGTTETGNVDDLNALAEIARAKGVHFHVDACWGGSAMLVDEYRPLFKGIERADSVSIDAHKLLYCPMAMGIILFKSERDLNLIRHSSHYIIRKNSVDTGRFTVEGSRPFAALKPWAALKIIGKDGYGLLLRQAKKSTQTLENLIGGCGNFEALNQPELFILNYRFIPEVVIEKISALRTKEGPARRSPGARGREQAIRKINHLINGLNIKLHKALRRDDTSFVSRTTLESTRYRPQRIVVLRAVVVNPLTHNAILKEIVETQNRLGLAIWRDFAPAYERICREYRL